MTFALLYLLFFTIDIYVVSELKAFGMIPVSLLVAGVGFYFCFLLPGPFRRAFLRSGKRWVTGVFLFYVAGLSVGRFLTGSYLLVKGLGADVNVMLLPRMEGVLMRLSGIVLLLMMLGMSHRSPFGKWMLWSSGLGFFRYFIYEFIPRSNLLFRYDSILDLLMLYGWLRILDDLIYERWTIERTAAPDFALD